MIRFEEKPTPTPAPKESADNRFDQVRKAAAEKHRKSEAETPRRPKQPKTDDEKLL